MPDKEKQAARARKHYLANREKIIARSKKWREDNPEAYPSGLSKWQKKNYSRVLENNKKWRNENKERMTELVYAWRKNNVEKIRAIDRRWKENNPGSYAERRAAQIKATPSWANKFFIQEAYRLARLRTKITGVRWHVDHIVPLRSPLVCGLHVENNLQVILGIENERKGNKFSFEAR